jgi:hypothetical protein
MKVRDFERIVTKLDLKVRDSRDRHAWFEYEGKVITRTKRSHGSGFDLPRDLIRQQLKLTDKQLFALISCTFSKDDYIAVLRDKKLL